eukprot:365803-Amphidinium_carterae.1
MSLAPWQISSRCQAGGRVRCAYNRCRNLPIDAGAYPVYMRMVHQMCAACTVVSVQKIDAPSPDDFAHAELLESH